MSKTVYLLGLTKKRKIVNVRSNSKGKFSKKQEALIKRLPPHWQRITIR